MNIFISFSGLLLQSTVERLLFLWKLLRYMFWILIIFKNMLLKSYPTGKIQPLLVCKKPVLIDLRKHSVKRPHGWRLLWDCHLPSTGEGYLSHTRGPLGSQRNGQEVALLWLPHLSTAPCPWPLPLPQTVLDHHVLQHLTFLNWLHRAHELQAVLPQKGLTFIQIDGYLLCLSTSHLFAPSSLFFYCGSTGLCPSRGQFVGDDTALSEGKHISLPKCYLAIARLQNKRER